MTDYFALFGVKRQPWLDLGALKEKYHRFAREAHPDVAPDSAATGFKNINAAYRVLSDPKQRLQHLLELEKGERENGSETLSEETQQLFLRIGALAQKARVLSDRMQNATGTLSRSLVKKEAVELRQQIETTLSELNAVHEMSLRELEQSNALWNSDKPRALEKLAALHAKISYLTRWIAQLKEMQLQLTPGRGG
jgi:curved DNA-binding protein CbpA